MTSSSNNLSFTDTLQVAPDNTIQPPLITHKPQTVSPQQTPVKLLANERRKHRKVIRIQEGDEIEITLAKHFCKDRLVGRVSIDGGSTSDFQKSYIVEFNDPACPKRTTPDGLPLTYWIVLDHSDDWMLHVAYSFDVVALLGTNAMPITSVKLVAAPLDIEIPAPHLGVDLSTAPIEVQTNNNKTGLEFNKTEYESALVTMNSPGILIPNTDYLVETRDIKREQQRRETTQNKLFASRKPRLIRNIPGALAKGMGIRPPSTAELHRKWITFEAGDVLHIKVDVTHPETGSYITSTIVEGVVVSSHEKSVVLKQLGKIYEINVIDIIGSKRDIFAFTPKTIAGLALRYWLAVYYDLRENKIMITTDNYSYGDIVKQIQPGEYGKILLAEYSVGDIRLEREAEDKTPRSSEPEDTYTPEQSDNDNDNDNDEETTIQIANDAPTVSTFTTTPLRPPKLDKNLLVNKQRT